MTCQSLFEMVPRCFECADIGFTVAPDGVVSTCWRQRAGAQHNSPGEAALMLERAVHNLRARKVAVDQHLFDVAKTLCRYTSAKPCKGERLIETHFAYSPAAIRNLAAAIETLRKVWRLPVGSRRGDPTGYWMITDIDDFAEWVAAAKAAPITQLTTIHRVAKSNFPVFAKQMELDFVNELQPVEPVDLLAA